MSREIKFRVWSYEDNEYRTDCNLTRVFNSMTGTPATVYSDEGDRFDIEQYTGLKDKNGKEIYEGDRVNIHNKNYKNEYDIGVVEFKKGAFRCPFLLGKYQSGQVEVIGNVHEPPKDFRPEHLKRMGVTMVKGGEK